MILNKKIYTDYALNCGNFLTSFGDLSPLPGPNIVDPKGIRDPAEWLVAFYTMPNYIKEVFHFQCEVALRNLQLYKQAVGNQIQIIPSSAADFGTQRGPYISGDMYWEFYKPFHRQVVDRVHHNTDWKAFFHHTCGSVVELMDDFIDIGVDILNPVQCSAYGMEPSAL